MDVSAASSEISLSSCKSTCADPRNRLERAKRHLAETKKLATSAGTPGLQNLRTAEPVTDALTIQMALREGERQLEQVKSMVGYVGPDDAAKKDEDSWLNTDDEEDPRGRVGVMWPWEQKK